MAVPTPAVAATATAVPNATGQDVSATITGGTVQTIASTMPNAPSVATPAVPATTVNATNTTGQNVLVTLTGGTVTVIAVNGTTVATATPASVVVPPGGTINLTYSAAPTWTWAAVFAGSSGNPLSSPAQLQIPPGGSATLFYTAAPTWAWNDPEEVQEEPGYGQMNAQAESGTYSEITAMPLTPHATGGLTGFATGVSN